VFSSYAGPIWLQVVAWSAWGIYISQPRRLAYLRKPIAWIQSCRKHKIIDTPICIICTFASMVGAATLLMIVTGQISLYAVPIWILITIGSAWLLCLSQPGRLAKIITWIAKGPIIRWLQLPSSNRIAKETMNSVTGVAVTGSIVLLILGYLFPGIPFVYSLTPTFIYSVLVLVPLWLVQPRLGAWIRKKLRLHWEPIQKEDWKKLFKSMKDFGNAAKDWSEETRAILLKEDYLEGQDARPMMYS